MVVDEDVEALAHKVLDDKQEAVIDVVVRDVAVADSIVVACRWVDLRHHQSSALVYKPVSTTIIYFQNPFASDTERNVISA